MNTSVKHFVHSDNIGSSKVITDSNGDIVQNLSYSPFGEQIESSSLRYGYEGKEYDSVLKQTDFLFRQFKPEWGIWTKPDTVTQSYLKPQYLNRFSFEANNPISSVDPDGHILWIVVPIIVVVLAVASEGAAGNAFVEYDNQIEDIQDETGASYSEARNIYLNDPNRIDQVRQAAIDGFLVGGILGGIQAGFSQHSALKSSSSTHSATVKNSNSNSDAGSYKLSSPDKLSKDLNVKPQIKGGQMKWKPSDNMTYSPT